MVGVRKRRTGVGVGVGAGAIVGIAVTLALHSPFALAQSARAAGGGNAATPTSVAGPALARRPKLADFQGESAGPEVTHVADWAVDSGDNGGMPYLIVDKANARVFVFDARGRLQGAQPALLGMVRGDGTAKGIGDKKLSAIRPEDRTTPAGRFVASLGPDLHGQDILWIDYASALALHRVVKGQPAERRAQRLDSATADDNRISYGCINVPVPFFETVVGPAFARSSGVVYILPETGPARALFGSYDVGVDAQARVPAPP
jgi:hypothetical protein